MVYADSCTFVLINITVKHVEVLQARGASFHHGVDVAMCVSIEASLPERENAPHERPPGCVPIWPWGEWGLDEGMEEGKKKKMRGKDTLMC